MSALRMAMAMATVATAGIGATVRLRCPSCGSCYATRVFLATAGDSAPEGYYCPAEQRCDGAQETYRCNACGLSYDAAAGRAAARGVEILDVFADAARWRRYE